MATFRVRDARRAAMRLRRYAAAARGPVGQALRIIGEEVMTDVKASRPGAGVPRDFGVLAGTGRVEGPSGLFQTVTLSFGGASAPYALVQHERLDYHHDLGEARYLVRGVQRWSPRGSSSRAALRAGLRAAGEAIGAGVG